MDKIKGLWRNQRVLIVLVLILIACLVAIGIITATYFFGGSDSAYGERLKDIKDYEITDELKNNLINKLKEDKSVVNVKLDTRGKVVYIFIDFIADTKLDSAKSVASSIIELIPENIAGYYDFNFFIESPASQNSEGWMQAGAKNAIKKGITWTNNTKIESEETTDEE